MSDFSFLSDSDDEKAVENLLSITKDQIILEKIAAINCSGFTDSLLPSDLETRFRKLKSFPTSIPNSTSSTSNLTSINPQPKPKSKCQSFQAKTDPKNSNLNSASDSDNNSVEENSLSTAKSFEDDIFSPPEKGADGKIAETSKSPSKSSPIAAKTKSNSDTSSATKKGLTQSIFSKGDLFSTPKKNPERKMAKESKSPSGSVSPPERTGCFWFSPKKGSGKMKKEKKVLEMGIDWEKEDELLSDLNRFSAIKQKKFLKKAMMVEEKINRDAEKISKWGK